MRFLLAVLIVLALLTIVLVGSAGADVIIGVYSDYGTSCSFSGNNAGPLTAHVVVRPNGTGIRGVRFAAPIPACFDAVFVGESAPYGIIAAGESQTGVSVTMPGCNTDPTHVLDITYYAGGATSACCGFPLVADPLVGYLEATNCAYASIPIQSVTSYMNADSSCACGVEQARPYLPSDPYPGNAASGVNLALALQWTCSNPEGLEMVCDLFLGTTPDPPLLAADVPGITNWSYVLPRLSPDTMYFWRVVAQNQGGGETPGPLWTFRTVTNNVPVVQLMEPLNLRTEVSTTPTLKWTGYDETVLTYEVYLGTEPENLSKVAGPLSAEQYSPSPLAFLTTYYWRVKARDLDGAEGVSETWHFTTHAENAPNRPTLIEPASGSNGNSVVNLILAWRCTDPEGQALRYDVYFGTSTDPPRISYNQPETYYTCHYLDVATTYYWRIVARDTDGLTRSGATWTFTTHANSLPYAPYNPDPHNGETRQPLNTFLYWDCRDPDGQSLRYDLYFGTVTPPPLAATNLPADRTYPGTQTVLTTYYWRIVARDPFGAETTGPIWSYTTKSADEPPNVPGYPVPENASTGQAINSVLKWYATDPENQTLNFDVYFGTGETPPLVADHVATKTYNPGVLTIATLYRWRIVSRDPAGQETSSPLWSFKTAGTTNIPPYAPSNPSPPYGTVTGPRPLLSWQGGDPDGDVVQYSVFMWTWDSFPEVLGTTTNTYFQVEQDLMPGWGCPWFVMAYDGRWSTQGPQWCLTVGGQLPVAFKVFEAKQSGAAVEVHWELASDEPMNDYVLYRREKRRDEPVDIAHGPVKDLADTYLDTSVEPGKTYSYELVIHASDGDEFRSQIATVAMAKLELALHQNVPNPFNPQTTIRYDVPASARVRLVIFDVNGRLVRTLVDEVQTPGSREAIWTGRDDAGQAVSSGVYFYVLEAGKDRLTKKLVLLK